MSFDPLIDEVRLTRDSIAREFGYDVAAVFRMLREFEQASNRQHVTLPARPLESDPESASSSGHAGGTALTGNER